MTVNEIYFRLSLSSERFLAYYQGAASMVSVLAEDGRRIRFPANVLRPYVRRDGVHGRFALLFDARNKFQGIRKLD